MVHSKEVFKNDHVDNRHRACAAYISVERVEDSLGITQTRCRRSNLSRSEHGHILLKLTPPPNCELM